MIRYNLAKLMLDREISATKMFNDIGIARSTISKISNNVTDKISNETLDKICNYLKVSPSEFFDYIPLEYSFDTGFLNYNNFEDLESHYKTFQKSQMTEPIYLYIKYKYNNEVINIEYIGDCYIELLNKTTIYISDVNYCVIKSDIDKLDIYKKIPIQFLNDILKDINKTNEVKNSFMSEIQLSDLTTFHEYQYELLKNLFP
ncbi:helix-turn-helix domain-containing protein [Streptococcus uberis]|uniref:helix-turn-helix domain-containing protein n=1 Tax=Streptococcus uberis TaxID=1349 RepID=UPI001939DBD5|nr:helix-turn-helix transcriptional regulator [Streptococcus uberis]